MAKIPNLKSSKAVGKGEKQKVRKYMESAPYSTQGTQGNFTSSLGNVPSLSGSEAVGQEEKQKVRKKINESGIKNPTKGGLL